VSAPLTIRKHRELGFRLRLAAAPLLAAMLGACAPQSEPRTVTDFMDDGFARDGVLSRCDQNREETVANEECANARRAAAALALQAQRAHAAELEPSRVALAPSFDVYADGGDPLRRRTLELEITEPANDVVIASPQIELTDLAVVPPQLDAEVSRQ
jgi:ABC-type uncharacterized transport system auxiliary subunit